jgi:predicted DNA-binding transcriptional regulator AlpA
MKELKVNPERLFTKTEYSREFGISRPTIDKMIRDKELDIVKVKGATLIKV